MGSYYEWETLKADEEEEWTTVTSNKKTDRGGVTKGAGGGASGAVGVGKGMGAPPGGLRIPALDLPPGRLSNGELKQALEKLGKYSNGYNDSPYFLAVSARLNAVDSIYVVALLSKAQPQELERVFAAAQKTGLRNPLMTSGHVNRVIQFFLENGTASQKSSTVQEMTGHVRELAMNQFGTFCVQRALERAGPRAQAALVAELEPHCHFLSLDPNGTFAIQFALRHSPSAILERMMATIQEVCAELAIHQCGSYVVKAAMEAPHATLEQRWPIVDNITTQFVTYSTHHYGVKTVDACLERIETDRAAGFADAASPAGVAYASALKAMRKAIVNAKGASLMRLLAEKWGQDCLDRLLKLSLPIDRNIFSGRVRLKLNELQATFDTSTTPALFKGVERMRATLRSFDEEDAAQEQDFSFQAGQYAEQYKEQYYATPPTADEHSEPYVDTDTFGIGFASRADPTPASAYTNSAPVPAPWESAQVPGQQMPGQQFPGSGALPQPSRNGIPTSPTNHLHTMLPAIANTDNPNVTAAPSWPTPGQHPHTNQLQPTPTNSSPPTPGPRMEMGSGAQPPSAPPPKGRLSTFAAFAYAQMENKGVQPEAGQQVPGQQVPGQQVPGQSQQGPSASQPPASTSIPSPVFSRQFPTPTQAPPPARNPPPYSLHTAPVPQGVTSLPSSNAMWAEPSLHQGMPPSTATHMATWPQQDHTKAPLPLSMPPSTTTHMAPWPQQDHTQAPLQPGMPLQGLAQAPSGGGLSPLSPGAAPDWSHQSPPQQGRASGWKPLPLPGSINPLSPGWMTTTPASPAANWSNTSVSNQTQGWAAAPGAAAAAAASWQLPPHAGDVAAASWQLPHHSGGALQSEGRTEAGAASWQLPHHSGGALQGGGQQEAGRGGSRGAGVDDDDDANIQGLLQLCLGN